MPLRAAAKVVAALALVVALTPLLHAAPAERPNLVFIMADDLGWRDLACFGSTFHQTPNVDRLAARGVKFTQAYAANPLCSPTRSSVLTGLWPARTGITAPVCHLPEVILDKGLAKGNPRQRVRVAQSVTRLKTDYITLPKVLKAAGYRTGHFGKWHLGSEPYSALQQGFEVDFPHWPGPGPAGSYVAPWAPAFPVKGAAGEHIEDRTAEAAATFIRENRDRPFYLNYWQFSVHAPYDPKPALVEKYRRRADPKNPQHNPVYAAMVESLDDGVGRVLAALEECGLMEKTVIVYFSDNGGVNWQALKPTNGKGGAKGIAAEFAEIPPTSNAPLRAGKASLYEGGVREPCIVHWPGVTRPGTSNDTPIQSIDWMPTLLEILGVPAPAGFRPDGISIVPALRGGPLARETLYWHFPHDTPASGQHPATTVRRGDWKLHRIFAGNADGSDLLELYNLREDLGETRNLAAQQPALVQELNARISGFLQETQAVIPTLNPDYRPAAGEAVEAPARNARKKS
ncbi:MAG: sulfatase [Verrucomicrobia bacterium]|nr:sulfatase [Verrucomicrobiota bacterium]